jgi:repressor LexA
VSQANAYARRQQAILRYVRRFLEARGYAPSVRQIQAALDLSSTSVVTYHLDALQARGLLQRSAGCPRSITLASPTAGDRQVPATVPLIGVLMAGHPLPQPEQARYAPADQVAVPPALVPAARLADVYALRVRGHGLLDALLDDGDVVLLRYQARVKRGDLALVELSGEVGVLIRRFERSNGRVILHPMNRTLPPDVVDPERVQVRGRLVGVLRSLLRPPVESDLKRGSLRGVAPQESPFYHES